MPEFIHNMPHKEYLALPRLSASGIKKLIISAQDFWHWSWLNPDPEPETKSEALNLGTAYHKYCLEGKAAFDKSYAIKNKVDGRTKEGKAYNEQFALDHPGATPIDERTYKQITQAKATFSGGMPEVTVLWNDPETNVPMKARIDYLTDIRIFDLKTFSNSDDSPIPKLLARHIVNFGYHIQAAVYSEAFPNREFVFVFQQTGAANNCLLRHFPNELLLAQQGKDLMRKGIDKFADMYRKFGTMPWHDEFLSESFTDESFPMWAYDG